MKVDPKAFQGDVRARRFYDPGTDPRDPDIVAVDVPGAPGRKAGLDRRTFRCLKSYKPKKPITGADSDQMAAAEMKRRRKGQKRLARLIIVRGSR